MRSSAGSLGPSHTRRPRVGFRAPRQRRYKILPLHPSVRGLRRSTARSYLCFLASETCAAWNGADPIFDARRLVFTIQSKSRGQLDRNRVETLKLADLDEDDN